jgi:cytochrome oxidase Cu insertion factor (SCO1/SenC/PrrC family)
MTACGATTPAEQSAPVVEKVMPEKESPAGEAEKAADKAASEAMPQTEAMKEMTEEPISATDTMAEKEPEVIAAATVEPDKPAVEAMAEKDAPTAEAMADDAAMKKGDAADEVMASTDETSNVAPVDPAWFRAELTNINTGETFTIADFHGKVVLVETMAVWCPLCTRQQGQIQALHELVGEGDDLVSLSLDIDPNENADILKAHADKNGFGWIYAVAPPEVAREIGQLYGAQFLNPPATPMFIIDRQGEVHPLPFGHKESTTLHEAVQPFLNEE